MNDSTTKEAQDDVDVPDAPPAPAAEERSAAARRRENLEELARVHAALAAAQERSYWLDRWGVDLNALMRRPGAKHLQTVARLARRAMRLLIEARRRIGGLKGVGHEIGAEPGGEPMPERGRFTRSISPRPLRSGPVTDLLFGRLDENDVEAIEGSLQADERALVDAADEIERKRLLLSFGVHHAVSAVLERTGLTTDMPPSEVHAMGRGRAAAGGSPYYADMVVDALASAGSGLAPGMRCLDFGCSSGRVVRVLAAAHPNCEWHGCDPIGEAIDWARAHLPGVAFAHSSEKPPLPYEDGSLDLVYAISIWSHFAERAALEWLGEIHRILRPGGMLIITTHGFQTLAHDHAQRVRSADQLEEIQSEMQRSGFWFKNEFGEGGDYGVDNAGWGTAFLTPEWLLSNIAGGWRVAAFAPGRVEDNQDLYALERL